LHAYYDFNHLDDFDDYYRSYDLDIDHPHPNFYPAALSGTSL
jgi:hypothetical protein